MADKFDIPTAYEGYDALLDGKHELIICLIQDIIIYLHAFKFIFKREWKE